MNRPRLSFTDGAFLVLGLVFFPVALIVIVPVIVYLALQPKKLRA